MTSYFPIKYTLIICFLLSLYVFSQDLSEIESIMLNEVELASEHSYADSRSYLLLKRRVLKVYPYVDTISVLLDDADSALKGIQKKRLSRRYSRKLQKKGQNYIYPIFILNKINGRLEHSFNRKANAEN